MKKIYRNYFHLASIFPFVIFGFFIDSHIDRSVFITLAIILFALIFGIEIYRLKNKSFKEKLWRKFSHLYKKNEKKQMVASIWGPIDLLLLVLFFTKPTIVSTLCIGWFCDPIAAIVGKKYGSKKNKLGKTWEGTFVFFISSIFLVLIANEIIHFDISLFAIILVSTIGALLERYIPFGDDNFFVPMGFALAFELAITY